MYRLPVRPQEAGVKLLGAEQQKGGELLRVLGLWNGEMCGIQHLDVPLQPQCGYHTGTTPVLILKRLESGFLERSTSSGKSTLH